MGEKRERIKKYTQAYNDYYQVVFNSVYTKVSNKEDAEDITQEIFLVLHSKLDQVDNIRKWLFGTLRNVVYNYYREKKPTHVNIDEMFEDISLTFVNGFKDTRLIIADAIEEEIENDEERMIIDMIAFSNYSYTYVGKLMGYTKKQIEYRYGKIAGKILKNLKERGIKDIEDIL